LVVRNCSTRGSKKKKGDVSIQGIMKRKKGGTRKKNIEEKKICTVYRAGGEGGKIFGAKPARGKIRAIQDYIETGTKGNVEVREESQKGNKNNK